MFANQDYEPAAVARDAAVRAALPRAGSDFDACKDQVIFGKDEMLTQDGRPYSVFTPYKNAWLKSLTELLPASRTRSKYAGGNWRRRRDMRMPSLADLGFAADQSAGAGHRAGHVRRGKTVGRFSQAHGALPRAPRFSGGEGPVISVGASALRHDFDPRRWRARGLARRPARGAATWLSELIWRDFYFMILHHHPRVVDARVPAGV